MSKEDFEVHPIGTTAELKFLRQIVKEIVEKDAKTEDLVGKILVFYEYHNEAHQI
jgi:hypothetical protein